MRDCYVSIPYGVKDDLDGRLLDFDYLYWAVIQPAVQEMDMDCRRLDEFEPGAIWHKTLFTALISSDLMIADVSTQNANVLYELGVRHAMRRGRTLLISAGGRLPGNVAYTQALFYAPDESGRLVGKAATTFREVLQAAIRQSQRSSISDSPIYEFFPDLQVILPPELERDRHARRRSSPNEQRGFAERVVESPATARDALHKSEREVRYAPDADPVEYLNLLRKYRDLSEWDSVIDLATGAPPAIADSPEVRQLLALALNRRGAPVDQEQAIAVMQQVIAETGGDSESFGILGMLYKGQATEATTPQARRDNLERALALYRMGLERNPNDYYAAVNVVSVLLETAQYTAARAEAEAMGPRINAALIEARQGGRMDYWELSAIVQLAIVARDWTGAKVAARLAASHPPSAWMSESTVRELHYLASKLIAAGDYDDVSERMSEILGILHPLEHQPAEAVE